MSVSKVEQFTLHNDRSESILASQLAEWAEEHFPPPFNTTSYTWLVNGVEHAHPADTYWRMLPDASGFICFDEKFVKDNCCLRNVYGEVTHKLLVPWELAPYDVPLNADMWFINVCTHVDGEFGVSAYIEYAGDYYFEFDYHNVKFLWGKPIRI